MSNILGLYFSFLFLLAIFALPSIIPSSFSSTDEEDSYESSTDEEDSYESSTEEEDSILDEIRGKDKVIYGPEYKASTR